MYRHPVDGMTDGILYGECAVMDFELEFLGMSKVERTCESDGEEALVDKD